ncbi:MAG: HAD-IIIA family hydrolase, partial [bacterium]|nr:HAD-IIIA family hydrolase [bacterium]
EIEEIVLLLGYMPEKITEHFGDGSKFGVKIKYSIGAVEDETGTRIRNAGNILNAHFLLLYCDNYWPLNLKNLVEFHNQHQGTATVAVYANEDGITKNNMRIDSDGRIIEYDKSRVAPDLNGVDIGFFILNRNILKELPKHNFSFEAEILPLLISKKQLFGYLSSHRYYSIGSPERIETTEHFLRPRKVIFLDRDGVINKKPPKADYVKKWEEFEFLPGSTEAIRTLNENGYEIFIISNQPGIARGMMSREDLDFIHQNMIKELRGGGANIGDIYCCLHGWNDGCECRKPKPGLLFQAAREHHIDLTKAIFIGDDSRDIEAGIAAGCKTVLVSSNSSLLDVVKRITN